MIVYHTISTGSEKGNCHYIEADDEILLLDLGVSIKNLKIGIDFNVSKIVGAIVTHHHNDHAKCVDDVMKMGKQVFRPYTRKDRAERVRTSCGNFIVDAFALTDIDAEHFVHTNADSTECPNYAFLIRHNNYSNWNLLYATDMAYIKWIIPNLHDVLLGVDYDKEMLKEDESSKSKHQINGHFSIGSCLDFIDKNAPQGNIILTHLSETNADADVFIKKISEITTHPVYVSKNNLNIILEGENNNE